MEDIPESGPSRPSRPTPIRSLRQPALLAVATRNDAGGLVPPARSDAVALKSAMSRKVEWRRKGERWLDKLSEETVSTDELRRAAKYLESHQWDDITHERHLNSLCSYPLCSRRPLAPYTSQRRISISTTKRAITEKEGNEEFGYSGKACRLKSDFVRDQLRESAVLRGGEWRLSLVEDLEEGVGAMRLSGDASSTTTDARKTGLEALKVPRVNGSSPSPAVRANGVQRPNQPTPQRGEPLAKSTAALASSGRLGGTKKPTEPVPQLSGILDSLVIHERPSGRPTAPGASASVPLNGASASSRSSISSPRHSISSAAISTTTHTSAAALARSTGSAGAASSPSPSAARAASSLISAPAQLTSSVLTAARAMGPIPQLPGDSDSESDISEWEMDMNGFEEDEETRALFDLMREAKELGDT